MPIGGTHGSTSQSGHAKRLPQVVVDRQLLAWVCWYSHRRTVIMKPDAAVAQWIEYRPPKISFYTKRAFTRAPCSVSGYFFGQIWSKCWAKYKPLWLDMTPYQWSCQCLRFKSPGSI